MTADPRVRSSGAGEMITGLIGVALIAGWLVYRVLWPLAIVAAGLLYIGIRGAVSLFAFAAEQGFVGIAAYVACWVFMFPVMLTASAIAGCIVAWTEHARSTPQPISPSEQAALWRHDDMRYEEHKRRLVEAARARGEH